MPKLTKKAIRLGQTDVRTNPNYRKASLLTIYKTFPSVNLFNQSLVNYGLDVKRNFHHVNDLITSEILKLFLRYHKRCALLSAKVDITFIVN